MCTVFRALHEYGPFHFITNCPEPLHLIRRTVAFRFEDPEGFFGAQMLSSSGGLVPCIMVNAVLFRFNPSTPHWEKISR